LSALQSDRRWLDYGALIQSEFDKEKEIDLEALKEEGEANHQSREESEDRKSLIYEEDISVKVEKDSISIDVDMDSTTDHEDYDLDDFEMSLTKIELETLLESKFD